MKNIIKTKFETSNGVFLDFANDKNYNSIHSAAKKIISSLNNNKKIISFGNGGSMCDAMHFTQELNGYFVKKRKPFRGLCVSDPSYITCVSNDTSFDFIFSRFIESHGDKGDIVLGISTSGNSNNVIEAFKKAREMGLFIISLTGNDGGEAVKYSDININVSASDSSSFIQEVHIKIIHSIIECIELGC